MDDEVVVECVLPGVREHACDDRPHAGDLTEPTKMAVVDVEVAQDDNVILSARCLPDRGTRRPACRVLPGFRRDPCECSRART